MLQSIVGPPLKGVADFASPDKNRDEKGTGSDSFDKVFEEKISSKPVKDKEEMKAKAENPRAPDQKVERPEKAGPPEKTERRNESEQKAEPEKAKATNKIEGKVKKENSQRQQAILNFMDSFESEFGVSPTRIVEAMAKLNPTDQMESPDLTADQVIGQLGLDDQQEDQAKEMYLGLLAQLAQIDQTKQQKNPVVEKGMLGFDSGVTNKTQERFAVAQEKQQQLNQSLDTLNQKFWMKPPATVVTPVADKLGPIQAAKTGMMAFDEESFAPQLKTAENYQAMQQGSLPPGLTLEQPVQENSEMSPEEALAALVAAARNNKKKVDLSEENPAARTEFSQNVSSEMAMPKISNREQAEMQRSVNGESADGVKMAPMAFQKREQGFEFSQQQQQQSGGESLGSDSKTTKARGEIKAEFPLHPAIHPLKQDAASLEAAPVMAPVNVPTPSKAENEANIQQVMNQAQYLIKKGGGEVKVEMTPEGMGQIHMKVLVQDGKVNLQMSAETAEAKKTLESGLSDLKNSLAAHKLSMDHVKIDVVSGTNTDSNIQNQLNNQNGGSSKDQTRQFWNNFNQNFGTSQQRPGVMEIPTLKGYTKKRTDEPLSPIQSAGVRKYADQGKGKGLDLVA